MRSLFATATGWYPGIRPATHGGSGWRVCIAWSRRVRSVAANGTVAIPDRRNPSAAFAASMPDTAPGTPRRNAAPLRSGHRPAVQLAYRALLAGWLAADHVFSRMALHRASAWTMVKTDCLCADRSFG